MKFTFINKRVATGLQYRNTFTYRLKNSLAIYSLCFILPAQGCILRPNIPVIKIKSVYKVFDFPNQFFNFHFLNLFLISLTDSVFPIFSAK